MRVSTLLWATCILLSSRKRGDVLYVWVQVTKWFVIAKPICQIYSGYRLVFPSVYQLYRCRGFTQIFFPYIPGSESEPDVQSNSLILVYLTCEKSIIEYVVRLLETILSCIKNVIMYKTSYNCITCHWMCKPPEYPRDTHTIKDESCWNCDSFFASLESNMVGKILEKDPVPEVIEWRDCHSLEYSVPMSKCSLHSHPLFYRK